MHRSKTIVVLTFVLLAVWAVTAVAADAPRYQGFDLNRQMQEFRIAGDEFQDDAGAARSTWGESRTVGSAVPPGSPGYRIGETRYDYQHNGSTGRQVDVSGTLVQATWMNGQQFSTSLGRTIFWNKMSVNGSGTITLDNGTNIDVLTLGNIGSADGQAAVATGNRPGYTTYRNRPNGFGAVFAHDAPEEGGGAFFSQV